MSNTRNPLTPSGTSDKVDIRQQAEKKVALCPENNTCLSLKETRLMIHELRVHQIELEMQNEELRRVQAELDATRLRYFDLYDLAPVGYVTLSETNMFLEANLTATTMLGVLRNAMLRYPLTKFILKDDQDTYYQFRKKLFETGEPQSCELWMVKSDGSTIWVHLSATLALNEAKEPVCRLVLVDITARKQSQQMSQALRIKENQYRELFEAGSDALLLIASNSGKIIDANKMASVLYGYERNELLTKSSTELSAEPEVTSRRIQDALNQPGKVFNIPLRMHRKKDGTVFPVEISARAFLQDGEPVLLVSSRDITERMRIEAELQAEKTNSEAMFESSPIALFVIDEKTNIVRGNGRAVDMFGGSAVAALQHRPGNALGCVHSSEDPRGCGYSPNCPLCPVRNSIQALLENGGEMNGVDLPLDLIRDGVPKKVWMEIGAKFVQLEGRRHLCIAMVDITERKRAEAALEKQNTLVTTLLNNLQIGVFMVEVPSGKPLLANQASFNLMGRGILPEAQARTFSKVYDVYKGDTNEPYPNDEMPIVVAMSGVSKYVDDMTVVRPDGTRVALEVYGSPIKDSHGNTWASLVSFQDITARKEAAEAVIQLAKAKNKFISVVSHELRSPLATIKEATSLVLERVLGPLNDEQKEMLDIAKININRLGRLVNNVLIYQKMDAGKMLYDFLENDVNDIIQEAYRNIILATPERKDDLVINLVAKPPRIKCDKDKIFQVILNLISNGIKYSERGPIVIETRLNTHEIEFSIRDSGQGIYPEELEHVFMPFSHGRGRKTGGTGLGLAISKEIILAHNGKMWVESEPRKGSTFYFTLPL